MTRSARFLSVVVAISFLRLTVPGNAVAAFIPALDDVLLSNSNGDLYVIKATDFNINYTDGGFGNVTGVQVTSGNLVLVSNTNGDLRLRSSDLASDVIPAANVGGPITTLGLRADGVGFIAGTLFNPGDSSVAAGRVALIDGDGYLNFNSPDGGYGTIGPNSVGFQSNGNVVLGSDNVNGIVYVRDGVTLNGVAQNGGFGLTGIPIAVQSNNNIVMGNRTSGILYVLGSDPNTPVEADGGFGEMVEIRVLANNNIVVATNYTSGPQAGNAVVYLRDGTDQDANNQNIAGIASLVFNGKTITAIATQSNGNIVAGFSDGDVYLLQQNGGVFNILTANGGYGTITDLAVFHAIPEPSSAVLAMLAIPLVVRRLGRTRPLLKA